MLSAEGMGIIITAATFTVTCIGVAIAGGIAWGTLKTTLKETNRKVDKLSDENSAAHKVIYECESEVNREVGEVKQHLIALNGSVRQHDIRITTLENK